MFLVHFSCFCNLLTNCRSIFLYIMHTKTGLQTRFVNIIYSLLFISVYQNTFSILVNYFFCLLIIFFFPILSRRTLIKPFEYLKNPTVPAKSNHTAGTRRDIIRHHIVAITDWRSNCLFRTAFDPDSYVRNARKNVKADSKITAAAATFHGSHGCFSLTILFPKYALRYLPASSPAPVSPLPAQQVPVCSPLPDTPVSLHSERASYHPTQTPSAHTPEVRD